MFRRLGKSQLGVFFRRFIRHGTATVGLAIMIGFFLLGIVAPLIAPYDPLKMNLKHTLEAPSLAHLLGRDELGRDILSRLICGARISLTVGLISVGISAVIGIPLGAISGFYGGKIDSFIQKITDIMLAFPGILLAIAVVSILGISLTNAMIAIGVSMIPVYIRLMRGQVLFLREELFVEAAKALGISDFKIIFRHIVLNALSPVIVQSTLQMASAILWAAGLGFLGLGAQPPTPEWGAMIADGRGYLRAAPHVPTFPGLAIFITVIGFNLVGDALRDALDPRLKM